jgi:hypothetical protein
VTGLTPASVVQLRWTHNVNERKTVQTNMISFVSHGTGILKICEPLLHKFLLRSPAECPANRNIIFRLYRFSFSLHIKF